MLLPLHPVDPSPGHLGFSSFPYHPKYCSFHLLIPTRVAQGQWFNLKTHFSHAGAGGMAGANMKLTRATSSFGCEGNNRWATLCSQQSTVLAVKSANTATAACHPLWGVSTFNSSVVGSERSNLTQPGTAMQNSLSNKQQKEGLLMSELLSTSWTWRSEASHSVMSKSLHRLNLQQQILHTYRHISTTTTQLITNPHAHFPPSPQPLGQPSPANFL